MEGWEGWGSTRPKRRASFPAHRVRSPHKSPSPLIGRLWGDAMGLAGEGRLNRRPTVGTPSGAHHRRPTPRTGAPLRQACHQAQRLARLASTREHFCPGTPARAIPAVRVAVGLPRGCSPAARGLSGQGPRTRPDSPLHEPRRPAPGQQPTSRPAAISGQSRPALPAHLSAAGQPAAHASAEHREGTTQARQGRDSARRGSMLRTRGATRQGDALRALSGAQQPGNRPSDKGVD